MIDINTDIDVETAEFTPSQGLRCPVLANLADAPGNAECSRPADGSCPVCGRVGRRNAGGRMICRHCGRPVII